MTIRFEGRVGTGESKRQVYYRQSRGQHIYVLPMSTFQIQKPQDHDRRRLHNLHSYDMGHLGAC